MIRIHKILIAEDELLIAKVLRLQLEQEGFIVDNVVDGNSAIDFVIKQSPDLIIMDNYLKNDTNGIDCAKHIRSLEINIPIIFVTGNSYDTTMELSNLIVNSTVMSKPVMFEHLLSAIKELENK